MGLRELFTKMAGLPAEDLLDPLLKSAGIDAALANYDPDSRQIVLAFKIRGKPRYVTITAGQVYTRAEICALIRAAQHAKPPPAP